MAVKQVTVYVIDIEDKPGSLQKLLAQSSLSGVDFQCFSAFSCGNNRGRAFVCPKKPKVFEDFARDANLRITKAGGLIVGGEDRVGAAAEAIKDLAESGISGLAGSAMVFDSQYKMLVVVEAKDAEGAAKALGG